MLTSRKHRDGGHGKPELSGSLPRYPNRSGILGGETLKIHKGEIEMNFDIEAKAKEVVEALGGTVEVVKGTMVAWHQSPAITKVILPNGIEFSFWPSNHYFAWELEVEGKKHMFYSHPYDGADEEELDKLEDTIRRLARL